MYPLMNLFIAILSLDTNHLLLILAIGRRWGCNESTKRIGKL